MAANGHDTEEWGNEPTVRLPAYRLMPLGAKGCGPVIHITPDGNHIVDWDCEGVCLACGHPMEGN